MYIEELKEILVGKIKGLGYNIKEDEIRNSIEIPGKLGDVSISIAFKLAKILRKNPNEIANEIKDKINFELFSNIKVENGYINIEFNKSKFSSMVLNEILNKKESYIKMDLGRNKKVIIEYPSVNPTKPWHIGHLRNALLGDSISNIYNACSYVVEREDYIDDLGLQVAETIWGYKNLGKEPKDKKFDQFLGEQYVKVSELIEKDEKVKDEINQILIKMEKEDTEEAKLRKEITEKCLKAQYETAFAYKIYHDLLIWESSIVRANFLDKAISLLKEKNAVEAPKDGPYANCLVVDLRKMSIEEELGNIEEKYKVLVRSNGVATYAAKDFAFHLWKFGLLDSNFKYKVFMIQPNGKELYTTSIDGIEMPFGSVDRVINIIDIRQKHEQAVVKHLFELIGREDIIDNYIHLGYEVVKIGNQQISGRKGTWLGEKSNYTADDLLKETENKAMELIDKNIEDRERIARAVALAAIKFEYLRIEPKKEISFDWSRALNFNENSGPYLLYTYARGLHIIEKTNKREFDEPNIEDLEYQLIKMLFLSRDALLNAFKETNPAIIAKYALDLATIFNTFYEKYRVINSDKEGFRASIVEAFLYILKSMLDLLGIEVIETL